METIKRFRYGITTYSDQIISIVALLVVSGAFVWESVSEPSFAERNLQRKLRMNQEQYSLNALRDKTLQAILENIRVDVAKEAEMGHWQNMYVGPFPPYLLSELERRISEEFPKVDAHIQMASKSSENSKVPDIVKIDLDWSGCNEDQHEIHHVQSDCD
jgi:hypothetical protein